MEVGSLGFAKISCRLRAVAQNDRLFQVLACCLLIAAALVLSTTDSSSQDGPLPSGHAPEIEGAIGPATHDYLSRGFDDAASQGASLLIIPMDIPGGLNTDMRKIIRKVLASAVPVVTYVAPNSRRLSLRRLPVS
jgi:membrane-bound serine protease (ClpP class)